MKRLTLLLTLLTIVMVSITALRVPSGVSHAQGSSDLIVLNDATPGLDVVINPSPNTTGVVALEVKNASVIVVDAAGNLVFEARDPRIQGIEFSFAPNAGTHTLTVQRLPGAVQGYARITALAEMQTLSTTPQLVSGPALALAQEADYPLNAQAPSSTVVFAVPNATYAEITARFPGAPVTAQLVNLADNRPLATLTGSLIDGVRFKVNSGDYELVMLNNNIERGTVANVSLVAARESDFDTMVAQVETTNTTVLASTTNTTTATNPGAASPTDPALVAATTCTLTIAESSVNLRSGPGTGYSVLEYAFRGEVMPVGGVSAGSEWLLVGTETGSGWVAGYLGELGGVCDNLPAYDIPYREAASPQVIIQQPQVTVYQDDGSMSGSSDGSSSYDDDHDEDEHEDEDDHEDEDEHEDEPEHD